MEAEKCQIFKTFYVTIFVVKSILFQLLLRFMCALIHVSISFLFCKTFPFPFQFQFQLTNITLRMCFVPRRDLDHLRVCRQTNLQSVDFWTGLLMDWMICRLVNLLKYFLK